MSYPAYPHQNMVSVICPTFGRPERHAQLYAGFAVQSYPEKELVVVDDSPAPSPFFARLRDARVTYLHSPVRESIGHKRNVAAVNARGQVLAHFDDDDFYAPTYLETMVEKLNGCGCGCKKAALVKLVVWQALKEDDGSVWEWDTRECSGQCYCVSGAEPTLELKAATCDGRIRESWLCGYGFSYVYRKSLWDACGGFEDMNLGEDHVFYKSAVAAGATIKHVADRAASALHTLHPKSTSKIFPQRRIA